MTSKTFDSRLELAVLRGAEWLASRQNDDGSFLDCGNELVALYKALLAYAKAGRLANGVRCLRYIQAHNINDDGELCSADGSVKTGFEHNQRNFANYMDGWVAIGAWMLGDYRFADRIVAHLHEQQAPHGGVLTGPKKWSGRPRYDILTGASCGRAFLLTGRRTAALAVAGFLTAVVRPEHQRNETTGLDMSFDADWGHVDTEDAGERPYYRLEYDQHGERAFCPAFACAFLCEIYQLTHDSAHLQAARRYFEVITKLLEFRAKTLSNGKSGWAAGMVALATGDEAAASAAHEIIPRVLARQRDDGHFGPSKPPADPIPVAKSLESTAEHTAWAAQYLRMASFGLWQQKGIAR